MFFLLLSFAFQPQVLLGLIPHCFFLREAKWDGGGVDETHALWLACSLSQTAQTTPLPNITRSRHPQRREDTGLSARKLHVRSPLSQVSDVGAMA